MGLAYLIDLPDASKMGKGEEKDTFLTEKARDRKALDFSDMAWLIINTIQRRCLVRTRDLSKLKS